MKWMGVNYYVIGSEERNSCSGDWASGWEATVPALTAQPLQRPVLSAHGQGQRADTWTGGKTDDLRSELFLETP